MTSARTISVGAAQLGPIAKDEPRIEVVDRLRALLRKGAAAGCDLIVFPELALSAARSLPTDNRPKRRDPSRLTTLG